MGQIVEFIASINGTYSALMAFSLLEIYLWVITFRD